MNNKPAVIGIDPGLDGGIAVKALDDHTGIESNRIYIMPTRHGPKGGREINATQLHELFAGNPHQYKLAAVEVVHSMPKQGIVGAFTFGKGYGTVLTVLEMLGIPIQHVTPQRWKKDILAGLGTDKHAAIRWCQSRYPKMNLAKSERANKPHDGICDAICLAEWARKMVAGKE